MHLRRNSETSVLNSVFVGYKEGLRLDGANTFEGAKTGKMVLENVFLANMTSAAVNGAGGVAKADAEAWFNGGKGNKIFAKSADLGLNAQNYNLTKPNFLPATGSALLSGAAFTNAKLSGGFFQNVPQIGAFGTTDWTTGWANFDPQNTVY